MTDLASRFVWYELMTTDTASARLFYGAVVGWGTRDASQPDMPYTLLTVGERPVAGLMDLPEQARKTGGRSSWIGYISVADVDAAADPSHRTRRNRACAAGGYSGSWSFRCRLRPSEECVNTLSALADAVAARRSRTRNTRPYRLA